MTSDSNKETEKFTHVTPNSTRRDRIKAQLLAAAKEKWQERVLARGLFAPNSPTPTALIHSVLQVLGPQLGPGVVVLDVGCGEGRWLTQASLEYGCRGIGVEVDKALLTTAEGRASDLGVAHLIDFHHADVKDLQEDFSQISVVIFYGSRTGCREMATFLSEKTLKPGALVVSVQFTFPLWEIRQTVSQDGFSAYLYEIPQSTKE